MIREGIDNTSGYFPNDSSYRRAYLTSQERAGQLAAAADRALAVARDSAAEQQESLDVPMSSSDLRREVETSIRVAFSGATLGDGVSIRQAEAIDQHPWDEPDNEFHKLKNAEVTSDWSQVPFSELERDNVAHLDAAGLRYYLPALMLSLLDHYDVDSMRVIGTVHALDGRDPYNQERYGLLSKDQRRAVARFVESLPRLVELDPEDLAVISRSHREYWNDQVEETRSDV